jgi:hypothetical protein
MLALFLVLAFLAGIIAAVAKSPPVARTLAAPTVIVACLLAASVAVPAVTLVAAPAVLVVTAAAVAYALGVDVRYRLSKIVAVAMRSTYRVIHPDETSTRERARWVQWRGHVMRHRRVTLA